jgi:formate dehydrogenase major subunit
LKALYVIGYDILLTNPNMAQTRTALEKLELVVVQDMFMNETAREVGTVFLPTASAFEKDGTFMNAERRIQRVRKVLEAPSGARPDWVTICALAAALGHRERFSFTSAEQIWEEIRTVWPAGAGIDYARLERGGLQWPCPSETHLGSAILHESNFARGPRATLRSVAYCPSEEQPSPEYPFVLITGRRLYQFNAGTMTQRTLNERLQPHDVLDVSPDDALRYELRPGELVQVRSRYGETELPVRIATEVSCGQLFATFHESSTLVNQVTSRHRDRITRTPEYKVTAVAISKQRQA